MIGEGRRARNVWIGWGLILRVTWTKIIGWVRGLLRGSCWRLMLGITMRIFVRGVIVGVWAEAKAKAKDEQRNKTGVAATCARPYTNRCNQTQR